MYAKLPSVVIESCETEMEKHSADETESLRSDIESLNIDTSEIKWMLSANRGRLGLGCSRVFFARFHRLLVAASLLVVFLLLYAASQSQERLIRMLHGDSGEGFSSVYNRTLGFQQVFAIGLPGRTDRRDALTVAASFSQIDIEWSDGVQFEDMPVKSIPEVFTDGGVLPTVIASWRAHLNVLSRIVKDNIQTALILEDDTDWDWNIKGQLEQFATGLNALQQEEPNERRRASPYGSAWDTLWVGNCRIRPTEETQEFYFITNDTTVPPVPFRRSIFHTPHVLPEVLSNDTRIVLRAEKAGCTYGYAITWEAARKVLTSMSLGGDGLIFDVAMADMCSGLHITPYNCYGVYPPLISSHRFAGSRNGDSDIWNRTGGYHDEYSWDLVYSVIQNAPRLLAGATEVQSQWPNDTVPSRRLDQKYIDEVSGEVREVRVEDVPEQHLAGINEHH